MLESSEPIFSVRDVKATVRFYREVLGFEREWFWGTPTDFGGVQSARVHVMFQQVPAGKPIAPQSHWFRSDDIRKLHDQHRAAGANITSPLENKPWNAAEYTVTDPDGHELRFAGATMSTEGPRPERPLPDGIAVELRVPTREEFAKLSMAVGWAMKDPALTKHALDATLFGAVAVDAGGKAIGMTRVTAESSNCYGIWDVAVEPAQHGKGIGSALMRTVLAELHRRGPKGAWVFLSTPRPSFYEPLGFSSGGGMYLVL